jgi:hypothetical protein
MKLAAIIKGDTAAKLARANEDIAATEQTIAAAQSERLAKLLDAPANEIEALDRKIADQSRVAGVYREQIARLEIKLADEQAERREKEYKAAVDVIEKAVAGLSGAAQEVEAAIRAVPAALDRFRSAQQAALRAFPENVERPFRSELGMERIERVLHECFRSFAPEWVKEAREFWSLERKLENIRETISDFAKAESAGYEAMIVRLREQMPQPELKIEAA